MIDRWLLAPAPAERLAALRVLIGAFATVYVAVLAVDVWRLASFDERRWEGVGLLAALDGPPPTWLARTVLVAAVLLAPACAAGWRWRASGPAFAALFFIVASYRTSWGHVIHTDHLVAVHLVLLAMAPAADRWSADARAGRVRAVAPSPRYGWAIQAMCLATVVTYVLAGIAKLRHGGLDWVTGDVLRNQVAFDNLRKALLGDRWSPIGAAMVAHSWLFTPFALLTVGVELGAPLAMLGGRWRTGWAALAWVFHVGVVAVMAIMFPYPALGFAYLPFFRAERLVAAGLTRLAARRPATDGSPPGPSVPSAPAHGRDHAHRSGDHEDEGCGAVGGRRGLERRGDRSRPTQGG